MADNKHASGAAVLVIQDLFAQDGVRHASFDGELSWPETTARGGPL